MQAHVRNIKTIRAELPHGECLFNEDGSATERPLGGFLEGLRDAAKALEKAYGNADNGNARLVGEAFHAPQTVRILASHAYNNLDKAVAVNVWTLLLLGVPPRRLCELFVDDFKAASDERPTI